MTTAKSKTGYRKLGMPLGLAIMTAPLLFGWTVLLPGYSWSTRKAALAWMAYGLMLAVVKIASMPIYGSAVYG